MELLGINDLTESGDYWFKNKCYRRPFVVYVDIERSCVLFFHCGNREEVSFDRPVFGPNSGAVFYGPMVIPDEIWMEEG